MSKKIYKITLRPVNYHSFAKIPRKTLLYYDKLGLITPELVDENGYRYYKRSSQLFLLRLILTLRQLDVPIARIKDYLGNRSPQNYRDLFNERIDFFTQEIARLQAIKTELQSELGKLDHIADITLDKIMLVHEQAHYLYLSNATEENECFKSVLRILPKCLAICRTILP